MSLLQDDFSDKIRGLSQNWDQFKISPLQGDFADRIWGLSQNWEQIIINNLLYWPAG